MSNHIDHTQTTQTKAAWPEVRGCYGEQRRRIDSFRATAFDYSRDRNSELILEVDRARRASRRRRPVEDPPLPRRSLLKEAGIATSLGVVVAASVISMTPSTRFFSTASCAQVAYFGWYQMHASKQSRNMKEYYEQNPTTGEQMGEGVAVPGSD